MKMFQKSLDIQANQSEAYKGMGYLYFRLGNFRKATGMLEKCLALNPSPNPVFELITGKNAIAPFKLKTTPRTKLGRIHLLNEDSKNAIIYFSEELKQEPDQPSA